MIFYTNEEFYLEDKLGRMISPRIKLPKNQPIECIGYTDRYIEPCLQFNVIGYDGYLILAHLDKDSGFTFEEPKKEK